jgi:WD40 repeat protein
MRTDEEVAGHAMMEPPNFIPGFGSSSPNEVDHLVMPYRETGVLMGERPIEPECMDLNGENLLAMGIMETVHWQYLGSDDSFKAIHMSQPSKCNLVSLVFDPTGCFLAAAFKDRVIRVYDLQAGRLCGRTAKLPLTEDVTALHWSGNLLAIGAMSGGLYLQDMKRSGRTLSCMEPMAGSTRWSLCQAPPRIRHIPPTMSLKWSRDGSQLASAVFGREIQVIDPRKLGLPMLFLDHPGIVNCMDWSPHHGKKTGLRR